MIDPRLLQLSDSAFPSGAFSHSFGLETAIAERGLRDADAIGAWIAAYLSLSVATLDGRALALCVDGRTPVDELDAALSAALFAPEVRAASRRLARATLDAYEAMGLDDEMVAGYRAALACGRCDGHHALACALGYRSIGATAFDASAAYLSATASTLAAAAARTVPLGQRDVGRMLWLLRETIRHAARSAASARTLDDLVASAIDCEIDAMRHTALDGRLFAS